MRARAAYISSFGTTGILVAAALLMLAMVSALVAFRGWPGGVPGDTVGSVPLTQQPRAFRLAAARTATVTAHRVRPAAPTRPARRLSTSTAGLVKVPARRPPVMVGYVAVPLGTDSPAPAGGAPAAPPGAQHGPVGTAPLPPPAGGAPLPIDPGEGAAAVTQMVDGVLDQLPPPSGDVGGVAATLGSGPGQTGSVAVTVGSTSVTVPLP